MGERVNVKYKKITVITTFNDIIAGDLSFNYVNYGYGDTIIYDTDMDVEKFDVNITRLFFPCCRNYATDGDFIQISKCTNFLKRFQPKVQRIALLFFLKEKESKGVHLSTG